MGKINRYHVSARIQVLIVKDFKYMEKEIYRLKRKRDVLVYNNTTLVVMLATLFIIRPAKEALIVLLGKIIGNLIYYILKAGNYIVLLILIGLMLYSIIMKKRKITMPTYFMLGYVMILFYSTVKMGSYSLIYLFELFGSGLAFFILFDLIGENKAIDCIRGIYYYLTFAMLLNSLTIYTFFPHGVYTIANGNSNYYLYALDNVGFLYEIATLALGIVYYICYEHRIPIRTYIIHIFIMGAYFYAGAATAMIVAFLALIFILTYKIICKLRIMKIINLKMVIVASIFVFCAIVLSRSVSSFSWLFDLVGKDSSFNSRTSIWLAALNIWKTNWLFGVGTSGNVINMYLHLGGLSPAWGNEIGHLHNVVLEILFDGGILAMSFFGGIILCPYRRMQKASEHIVSKILCVFFFLQWLSVMFDFRTNTYTFWLISILMYHIPYLTNYYNCLKRKGDIQ